MKQVRGAIVKITYTVKKGTLLKKYTVKMYTVNSQNMRHVNKRYLARIDTTEFADHVRSYNTMPPFNFSSVMFPLAKVTLTKCFQVSNYTCRCQQNFKRFGGNMPLF